MSSHARKPWLKIIVPPALLFAGTLALYVRTLLPGVNGGDIGEIQFLAYRLGLAHSTGYPLLLLLGRLWIALLPFGSVALRINLLSAVCGAATVALIGLLIQRLTDNALAALAGGALLAAGPHFWELAIDGDKYALNGLFVALILWLAWRWAECPTPARLYVLAAMYGLSLTHHRSMIVMAPLLAIFVLARAPGILSRPREIVMACAAWVLPLTIYFYLPWAEARGLPPGTWHPVGLRGWIDFLVDISWTGQVYLSQLTLGQLRDFVIPAQFGELGWGGLVLAIVGAVGAFRRDRGFAALSLVAFLLWAILTASNNTYDQDPRMWVQSMPLFVIAGLWCGFGVAMLANLATWVARRWPVGRFAGLAMAALLLVVPAWRLTHVYPAMRALSRDTTRLDPWRQILKFGYLGQRLGLLSLPRLAPRAIVVADWEQATVLWYFQQVEGLRPDMEVIYPIERLNEARATGRPVYLGRALPGIGESTPLSMAGPLIALLPEPEATMPSDALPAGIVFSDTLALEGYRYEGPIPRTGGILPITLYWRALVRPPADYAIGLRLLNADGNELWKEDSQHPVLGCYPTHLWTPGQIVADYYEVPLDRTLSAGQYRLAFILYTRTPDGRFANLPVGGQERGELPAFVIDK